MNNTKAMQAYLDTYEHPIISILISSMKESPEHFSGADMEWIFDNQPVVVEFFKITDQERIKGLKSGSWLVANQVRWRTRTHEKKGIYKLNNNHISLLAHGYNVCPKRAGYFLVKGRKPLGLEA